MMVDVAPVVALDGISNLHAMWIADGYTLAPRARAFRHKARGVLTVRLVYRHRDTAVLPASVVMTVQVHQYGRAA
jgi:hypothetical protein